MLGIPLGWPNFKWCNVQWSCQTIIPKLLGKSWDLTNTNGDVTRSNDAKCRTKQYWAVFLRVLECFFFLFFSIFASFFCFLKVFLIFSKGPSPKSLGIFFLFFFGFLEFFFGFLSSLKVFLVFSKGPSPKSLGILFFFGFSNIFANFLPEALPR